MGKILRNQIKEAGLINKPEPPLAKRPLRTDNLITGGTTITVGLRENIQKAVDAVENAGGGKVIIKGEKIPVNYDITVPSFVTLEGEGRDNTILDFGDNSNSIKIEGTAASRIKNIRIRDLTIQNSGTYGCDVNYADFLILDNVRFSSNTGSGLRIRASQQYMVLNCLADNNTVDGYTLAGNASHNHGRFNYFGCIATDNTGNGFDITGDATNVIGNGAFIGCEADNNILDGFELDNGNIEAAIYFGECIANSNTVNGFDVNIGHSSFIGCKADSNGGDGFENTGTRNAFIGCVPSSNTGEDFNSTARCSFTGNQFKYATNIDPSTRVSHDDISVQSTGNTGGNTRTEKNYMQMLNTSGGTVAQGGVVVLKAVADGDEITTTTTAGDDNVFGMAMFSHADNAWGAILTEGYTTKLKVDGTTDIAIGDYLGTFTTAGIASKVTSGMAFAVALEAYTTDDSSGVINALLITPRKVGVSTTTAKAKATKNDAQTITTGTATKIELDDETYDPGSNYDNATNYRFVAPQDGYYQVNGAVHFTAVADGERVICYIYKDGSSYSQLGVNSSGASITGSGISDVVYLAANSYVELWAAHTHGSDRDTVALAQRNFLSVHLLST